LTAGKDGKSLQRSQDPLAKFKVKPRNENVKKRQENKKGESGKKMWKERWEK